MNLALLRPMTLAGFLEWEERQPWRYEFDGVGPVAMTGGTLAHARIQRNLAFALTGRLRGSPCEFLGSDLKIRTTGDHVRYPDGFVTCAGGQNMSTVLSDPIVIFEVLSPSTAAKDRIVKAREYQAMPSVQSYVMLEQDRIGATVYSRAADAWTHEILIEGSVLALLEIGVELPLAELYEGIAFGEQDEPDQPPEFEAPC
jgi:Uma2 family endonuclease